MDYAIIVAGGKGLRMGTETPKQFLPVEGLPILMRTISRFRQYSHELQIIVVLPESQHQQWQQLCQQYHFTEHFLTANGGRTRFHSVLNALSLIPDEEEGVVAVHDGVRPFTPLDVIANCYEQARRTGAVIPVTSVVETLRHIDPVSGNGQNVLRSDYKLVQTPQTFNIRLLKQAYSQPYTELFTDDASVAEAAGHSITMVEGDRRNIKITTPFDMELAQLIAQNE